jgi:hypothetical protein
VLDRRMLEERACECYWIAQQAQAVAA